MNDRYEHEGKPLNKPIIRDILTNKQPLPPEQLSTREIGERVSRYHLRRGGASTRISSYGTRVRNVLDELTEAGIVERIENESGSRVFYRSLHNNRDPIYDFVVGLVRVIKSEREYIASEIRKLEAREAQLDKAISEYEREWS